MCTMLNHGVEGDALTPYRVEISRYSFRLPSSLPTFLPTSGFFSMVHGG